MVTQPERHARSPAVVTVASVLRRVKASQDLSAKMALAALVTTPAIMPKLGTLSIPARGETIRATI